MGRIPQEIIDQILDRIDIVEIISEYVPLKRAGRNYKAPCPFHDEKTPSFVVSPDKQIYHCFGCGAGGNVLGFVMNHEHMDFRETVEMFAARAGIELPKDNEYSKERTSLADNLYKVNEIAQKYYHNYIKSEKGKAAYDYVISRGISEETIDVFTIGCAPDSWDSFRTFCNKNRISDDILRSAGLTVPSQKGKNDYDRFRNRIIFPIHNERGKIVAFGGRVMDNSLPKYINSPDTVIYSKSNILYGLGLSKKAIREEKHVIIVEGYLDVVIPFQAGIKNIVAASGTALTPRQVSMIKKYTDTAVMVFDSDSAGEAASLRGLDVLIENDMNVRIAALPENEDPDSFIRKYGKESFKEVVSKAQDLFAYKLDLLRRKYGARNIGPIVDEMLPTLSKISHAVIQSEYVKRLAESLSVHEASLRLEMGKVKPDYSHKYAEKEIKERKSLDFKTSELHLLGLSLRSRKAFLRIIDELDKDVFTDVSIKKGMEIIGEIYNSDGCDEINISKLISRLDEESEICDAIIKSISETDITKDKEKVLDDCISFIKKQRTSETLKTLTGRLKEAQNRNNSDEMREILIKINKIHKERVV